MKVLQVGISAVVLFALTGCSSLGSDKLVDYGAGAKQLPKLEVPPDLTAPETDERYKVPQSDGATTATYSDYSKGDTARGSGAGTVLPEMKNVHLEREGARRWLVVNEDSDKVWAVAKAFWQETGLTIMSEDAAAGVMETDWAENRARIPKSAIRDVLGKVFDNIYSSNEKDQYLTRLERGKDGKSTEVYITHRGIEQVYSEDKTSSRWQARANEPELEAIMLQRLMVRFGASETQAKQAVAAADAKAASSAATGSTPEPAGTASLREVSGGNVIIVVNDAFDRSWRRVGLAIESAELGVEDKDREMGTYFLRPIKVQGNWAEKLKFWKHSDPAGKHYRVNVKDGGTACEVSVTGQDGASDNVTRKLIEEIYKHINQ
ncbi:MAG: outer membrane protein assembly factor BamC [Pseudomonadota bacterium]